MKANPQIIQMFANRTKCHMCKHKFEKPYILPVEKIESGAFKPNFNVEVSYHLQDTHGIPYKTFYNWIAGAVYEQELTLFSNKGFNLFKNDSDF